MTRTTALAAAGTIALLQASPVRAQAPVFRGSVESILVDVLVTDGRRPIEGLRAGDFELFDNGVLQDVRLLRFDRLPLNVVLALDVSASVAGERLDQLRHAGHALLDALLPDDQAALVSFSNKVGLGAPLSKERANVRGALDELTGGGTTALVDGVYSAVMIGEGDAGRSLVIVFSDGVDTASWLTDDRLIDTIKRSDAVVYGVVVRSKEKPELLDEIAALSGGRLHEIDRVQNLEATFLGILKEYRTRYLLNYTPQPAGSGWHRIEVRVKNRRATVKARPGYLAGS